MFSLIICGLNEFLELNEMKMATKKNNTSHGVTIPDAHMAATQTAQDEHNALCTK